MQRELGSFPLPPHLKKKLSLAGFSLVEDLHNVKPSELSKEISITTEEALEVLATVSPATQRPTVRNTALSALELLQRENNSSGIMTFCEEVDDMLGGGVPLAKITELCGSPGVGKTQFSIQLAVDVQIPETFGGLQGEAVFIDTEGSFIPQRAADIASAVQDHCRRIVSAKKVKSEGESFNLSDFTVEKILSRIHYFRCHNYTELLALVNLLPQFIKEHEKIKLIIIDSIAFHFRHDFDDMSLRTRLLNGLAQSLIKMAVTFHLAVVLTNQMTTKLNTGQGGSSSHLSPALGESWGHAATLRVILSWRNNQRFATLYKSPSKREMTVPYQVTVGGIRSVQQPEAGTSSKADQSSSSEMNPRKRRRPHSQENG